MVTHTPLLPHPSFVRKPGLHWLRCKGTADAPVEPFYVALQWNPGPKTWTHSNGHTSSAEALDVSHERGYTWLEAIPESQFARQER